ncbi:hypothetical protein UY3_07149 [Chelonia mydas]|uniref:Uncharacterized protein n=1 Tax=Chelonia mydas TaxID=8469 RepID=M7BU95_CHEMY|nr:hypothetical protein UY3_07149 [Chelonia mydas]
MGAAGSSAGRGMCWLPFPQPPLAWSGGLQPVGSAISRTCGRGRFQAFNFPFLPLVYIVVLNSLLLQYPSNITDINYVNETSWV